MWSEDGLKRVEDKNGKNGYKVNLQKITKNKAKLHYNYVSLDLLLVLLVCYVFLY